MVQVKSTHIHHTTLLQSRKFQAFIFLIIGWTLTPGKLAAQDISGLEVIRTLEHQNYSINDLDCYFEDGHQLLAYANCSGSSNGSDTLVIYDFGEDQVLAELPGYLFAYTIHFVNADQLLYSNDDTLYRIVNFESPVITKLIENYMTTFAISPDKSTIAILRNIIGWEVVVMDYDRMTGMLNPLDTFPIPVDIDVQYSKLTFSPDGRLIALNGGYENNFVYIINTATKLLSVINTPDNEGTYSPAFYEQNGQLRLAVGGGYANGGIEVINMDDFSVETSVPAFLHYNYSLGIDQTQGYLVCGGYDGIIKLFRMEGADLSEIYSTDLGGVTKILFTQDNQFVISGHGYSGGTKVRFHRILREPSAVRAISKNMLTLYPNPTTGMLHLDGSGNSLVSIYDTNGRLVWRQQTTGLTIDVSQLNNGVYLLKAESRQSISASTFVKY